MSLESAEARLLGVIAALVATAVCGVSVARRVARRRRGVKRWAKAPEPGRPSWPEKKEVLAARISVGDAQLHACAHHGTCKSWAL